MSDQIRRDPDYRALRAEITALRSRLERAEAALARIRDHGETHNEPCWALHQGDCADKMQEIARAALPSTGEDR